MVFWIIGGVIALLLIGFVKELLSALKFRKDLDFLHDYNEKYVRYLNSYLRKRINSEEENKLYGELISKSPKAQRLLGGDGLISYKPAGASYMYNNYQILLNTVQSLRNPSLMSEEFSWVNNLLIMKMATYNDIMDEIRSDIKNPFVLLREGVQFFVTLPIMLLYWTGITNYTTSYKWSNNIVVKLLSFGILLLGLISSIITVVLGWEQFKGYLFKWLL
ncbi:hypothetical protein [Bacillus sp. RO1]|uniref:hypothetical protein n=1 Tax=Bacillus sp. RO1 TaxID=2722703 RepID=UPI001456E23F|nr:hypothetical protein [Bacillus sp. RO1]NLP51273.1 hypothetical protein [Bacillus sp. RO1]